MIYLRCPDCDHAYPLHSGEGCKACSCTLSPRGIMERRLLLAEEDITRQGALIAEMSIRLASLETATRAYGIIE